MKRTSEREVKSSSQRDSKLKGKKLPHNRLKHQPTSFFFHSTQNYAYKMWDGSLEVVITLTISCKSLSESEKSVLFVATAAATSLWGDGSILNKIWQNMKLKGHIWKEIFINYWLIDMNWSFFARILHDFVNNLAVLSRPQDKCEQAKKSSIKKERLNNKEDTKGRYLLSL